MRVYQLVFLEDENGSEGLWVSDWELVDLQIDRRLLVNLRKGVEVSSKVASSIRFDVMGKMDYLPVFLMNMVGWPLIRTDFCDKFLSLPDYQIFAPKSSNNIFSENYRIVNVLALRKALSSKSLVEFDDDGDIFLIRNLIMNKCSIEEEETLFRLTAYTNAVFCGGEVKLWLEQFHEKERGVDFQEVKLV